jgi:hypothetical protein
MDCLHAGRYLSDRPRTPLWADGECTDPCVITWRQRSITVRRHQLHHILQVSEKLQTPPSASLWITAERSHYPRMACSCAHAFSRFVGEVCTHKPWASSSSISKDHQRRQTRRSQKRLPFSYYDGVHSKTVPSLLLVMRGSNLDNCIAEASNICSPVANRVIWRKQICLSNLEQTNCCNQRLICNWVFKGNVRVYFFS